MKYTVNSAAQTWHSPVVVVFRQPEARLGLPGWVAAPFPADQERFGS